MLTDVAAAVQPLRDAYRDESALDRGLALGEAVAFELDDLAAELSPPLRFRLVGPLPPHSFVTSGCRWRPDGPDRRSPHPAARTRARARLVFEQVAEEAEAQYRDPRRIRLETETEAALERGELDEESYEELERELLARLRDGG